MSKTLKINGWDKWQSYRTDRGTPPWIKVHRNLLSNQEWASLSDCEKGQLVSIWILAADKKGVIPADPVVIQKMCMMDVKPNLSKLIDLGFILKPRQPVDAKVTSEESQGDQPETETETEKKKNNAPFQALAFLVALGVEKQTAGDFLKNRTKKRLASTLTAFNGLQIEIEKTGLPPQKIIKICGERGWGAFKASWDYEGKQGGNGSTNKCGSECFSFASCKSLGKTKLGQTVGCYCHPEEARR